MVILVIKSISVFLVSITTNTTKLNNNISLYRRNNVSELFLASAASVTV